MGMTDRLIVLDGRARSRLSLKSRLGLACYQVAVAADLAECLTLIQNLQPRIAILSDPSIPDMAAWCRKLSALQPAVRIVALAPGDHRLDLLEAGASAVIAPTATDQLLLATLRSQLRIATKHDLGPLPPAFGMSEAPAQFNYGPGSKIALVADGGRQALTWQRQLQSRLRHQLRVMPPGQALQEAAEGSAADLYLLASLLDHPSSRLSLMAELRAREESRHSAYILALPPDDGLQSMALDLGASDLLPDMLDAEDGPALAAWVIERCLADKCRADQGRAEAYRKLRLATTDALTGLENRHHATEILWRLSNRAVQDGSSLALMMIDLDRFKSCNENFGHPAGDAVLQAVGARIAHAIGGQGFAARMGGDEFLVLLPHASSHLAPELAEAIRHSIAQHPIALPRFSRAAQTRATASIGAARIDVPGDIAPDLLADFLIEAADRAENLAKARGGNRVELANPKIDSLTFLPFATRPGLELSGSNA